MTAAADALGAVVLAVLAATVVTPWLPRPPRERERASAHTRSRRSSARAPAVDEAVVLDLVRAALAAGADVVTAVESVGSSLPPVQAAPVLRAARSLRLGATWGTAWPQDHALAEALGPAWSDGVDPDALLRHAAATIRRGRQAAAREAAARLGVRLVLPLGLCLLPAFVLLGLVPLLLAAGIDLWG